jgi:chromosome segregation ATPase
MEHWSGVMAWEVRRLERISAETQARFNRQTRIINNTKSREAQFTRQISSLEEEVQRRSGRVEELEEMVVEMSRRERAIEEEVRDLEGVRDEYARSSEGWKRDKGGWDMEKLDWKERAKGFEEERQGWVMEKRMLVEAQKAVASPKLSDKDKAVMENIRTGLGRMLGRKSGAVGEEEIGECLEEVGRLLGRRENEVASLKEEMREVNMGLEEEIRRVRGDRDGWKAKAEKVESAKKEDATVLERKMRVRPFLAQNGVLADLMIRRVKVNRFPT